MTVAIANLTETMENVLAAARYLPTGTAFFIRLTFPWEPDVSVDSSQSMSEERGRPMKINLRKRPLMTVAALFAVLVLIAAACGDDDASTGTPAPAAFDNISENFGGSPAATGAPAAPQQAGRVTEDSPNDLGSGSIAVGSLQPIDIGRDIIFRADMTIAVTDVASAGAEATTVIDSLGGFMFGQQTTGGPTAFSVLTFKVPPENFQAALSALGTLGELRSQNVFADDVTERVVDLRSRISTTEASVTRLRAFLSEANDIVMISDLEGQLLNRETTLETMRAQLRTLEDQVSLATITVSLTTADISPDMRLTFSTYLGHDDAGQSCPNDNLPAITEGDKVTLCYEITNIGDTALTGITLRDTVLEIDLSDLLVVFGDLTELEQGQTLLLAYETTTERDLRTQTRVTAEPVKEDTGEVIPGRTVSRTVSSFSPVNDPGGIATFGDGLSASWGLVKDGGSLGLLFAGALLPFIPLIAIAGWFLVRAKRRRDEHLARMANAAEARVPVPAPPQAPPPPPQASQVGGPESEAASDTGAPGAPAEEADDSSSPEDNNN